MKTRLKNYLSITKKEWNGLVVLVVLIALVLTVPYVCQYFHKETVINFKDFDKAAAALNKEGAKSGFDPEKEKPKTSPAIATSQQPLSPFNPNGLTATEWQQLGITAQQAEVIKHYEDKGGRFYSPADLKKIYGITEADYKRLEPYIVIPDVEHKEAKLKSG